MVVTTASPVVTTAAASVVVPSSGGGAMEVEVGEAVGLKDEDIIEDLGPKPPQATG